MKKIIRISTVLMLLTFFSCKSAYSLVTKQGNKADFILDNRTGRWEGKFDRDKIFNDITSTSKDTTLNINPYLFFQKPVNINRTNKKGERIGLWITGNVKYFAVNNYHNGKLHGKSVSYLGSNESIVCGYKKGDLHGVFERRLGEHPFIRNHYKNGKLTKSIIISPKW
jgi:hypothetical protein